MRIRALLAASAAALTAALALPGTAHAAGQPLTASITCDAATDTISTSISGGTHYFVPGTHYTVEFQVHYGTYVTTGSTSPHMIPQQGESVTVPVVAQSDGSLPVTAGYERSWPAEDYAFYTETVRTYVRNTSGQTLYGHTDGTCTRDLRTTVTLTCDRDTQTITARVTGVDYAPDKWVNVQYFRTGSSQATADSPRFTRQPSLTPDVLHFPTTDGTGAWSDVGYTFDVSAFTSYYYDEKVTVTVTDPFSKLVIGRGSASCVYADQSGS